MLRPWEKSLFNSLRLAPEKDDPIMALPAKITALTFAILIFFILYIKLMEKKGIFYPSPTITATPKDAGLDYEDIYFPTPDGLTLNAWYVEKEGAPFTLLFCHGNAGNLSQRVELTRMFHEAGLDVFVFDYRGFGRSQGKPTEEGLYTDALAAYQYLVKEKKIAPQRILLLGKSIGANVAADLATKAPARLLILDSGVSSALDMARVLFPFVPKFILKYLLDVKFDAAAKVKKIKVPKLIIHSRDDEVVPFRLGKSLYEEALAPKEFYEMRGSHNEAVYVYADEFMGRIKKFIETYTR